jgi:hypothetical protein
MYNEKYRLESFRPLIERRNFYLTTHIQKKKERIFMVFSICLIKI